MLSVLFYALCVSLRELQSFMPAFCLCSLLSFDGSTGIVHFADLPHARTLGEINFGSINAPFLPYLAPEQVRCVCTSPSSSSADSHLPALLQ